MGDFIHKSVLLDECIESLNIKPHGVYVDGTLGLGGHSEEILKRLDTGLLIAVDRDIEAIKRASERLSNRKENLRLVHDDFRNIKQILGEQKVDGILLDLGVSSMQLDDESRGFSYMASARLDMRMNRQEEKTAFKVVNEYEFADLLRILRDYGEEKFAFQITKKIVAYREKSPIEDTLTLVDIIKSAMPRAALNEKQHPAKRTFQAIRIEVNEELGAISEVLGGIEKIMMPGGRISVITFHSLEDRIVKSIFREMENPCICPKSLPICGCGRISAGKALKGYCPKLPSQTEIDENPRARSAKLRVFEINEGSI